MNKDPRRVQERRDFNMVQEDHAAMANLSPRAMQKEVPKWIPYPGSYYDNVVYRKRGSDSYEKYEDTE